MSAAIENARVMVLAATNRPSELDEAIVRRFTQVFEIGKPNQSERVKILKVILKGEKVDESIDYEHIAALCEGFTGSDLLELCKQAAYFPIRDLLDNEKSGKSDSVSSVTCASLPPLLEINILCAPRKMSKPLLLATFM